MGLGGGAVGLGLSYWDLGLRNLVSGLLWWWVGVWRLGDGWVGLWLGLWFGCASGPVFLSGLVAVFLHFC